MPAHSDQRGYCEFQDLYTSFAQGVSHETDHFPDFDIVLAILAIVEWSEDRLELAFVERNCVEHGNRLRSVICRTLAR